MTESNAPLSESDIHKDNGAILSLRIVEVISDPDNRMSRIGQPERNKEWQQP